MRNIIKFSKKSRLQVHSEIDPDKIRKQKVDLISTLRFRAFNHQPCCQTFIDAVSLEAAFKYFSIHDLDFCLNLLFKEKLLFSGNLDYNLMFAFSSEFFFDKKFSQTFSETNVNASFEGSGSYFFAMKYLDGFLQSSVQSLDNDHPLLKILAGQDLKNRLILFSKSSLLVNYYIKKFQVGRRLLLDVDYNGLIGYGSKGWSFYTRNITQELICLCEELVEAIGLFQPEDVDLGADFSIYTSLEFIYHVMQHSIYWPSSVIEMCRKLVKLSCFWISEHADNYLSGDNLVWSMSWASKATSYLFRLKQLTLTQGEIFSKVQLNNLLDALEKFQSKLAAKEIGHYHSSVLINLVLILKPYFSSIQEPAQLNGRLEARQETIFRDISRYEFVSELGTGSHGKVYKSFDTLERKLVAIKKIPCTEAVEAEARILMMIDHRYIVRYQDVFLKDNNMYLIMEYCEGNNLSFFRKAWKSERLKEEKIKIIGRQILIGLAYLHAHHIVHRDIKPENVFLTGKGIVKIGDFGEAHLCGYNDREKFDLSSLLGTVSFMAPECLHDSNVGSSADIWSFGCLLFFLVCGKRPWADLEDNLAILYHMATTEDRPHSEFFKDTSDELKEVLDRCFIRNPKTRPTAVNLLESQFFAGAVECLD